jgi:hypothetical protein
MMSFMISVVPVRTKAPGQILEIKLSERLALAPAGQDQQGLPGRVELAPARADLPGGGGG